MKYKFEKDVRSVQTNQRNFAGIFQNFRLARVYSPLQESEGRREGSGDGDDNVSYFEPGPEVWRQIHALLLLVGLFLVYGGMTIALISDKISNKRLRRLLLVCGGIAACGAPVFMVIGWGLTNLIE